MHMLARVSVLPPSRRGGYTAPTVAKRNDGDTVKTTVELPGELWRAAKIRAMDERTDLRTVLIRALEDYLRQGTSAKGRPGPSNR